MFNVFLFCNLISIDFPEEILRPKNGEILDTRDLKIIINIHGFDTQTSYYSSSICVALSTGQEYSEQCFDHTDFTFHANGLLPGTNYGLRIVLFGKTVFLDRNSS